jgi:hypothetical protein
MKLRRTGSVWKEAALRTEDTPPPGLKRASITLFQWQEGRDSLWKTLQ